MAMQVLTYDEAAEALGVSRSTIYRRVRRGRLQRAATGQQAANGRMLMGVLLPDPIDTRAREGGPDGDAAPPAPPDPPAAGRDDTADHPPAVCPSRLPTTTHQAASPCPAAPAHVPTTPGGAPDTAAMRAMSMGAAADEYDRRMHALARLRRYLADADDGEATLYVEIVAEEEDVSARTIYRWRQTLEEAGPAALVPDRYQGRGETVLPDLLQRQIRQFYLSRHRPTVAQVWREVVRPHYRAAGGDPPHYSTIRRYLERHVRPLEAIAFREGTRAYQELIEPKVRRDWASAPVNGVWCADHRLWDVMVLAPDGKGTGWGRYGSGPCPCGSGRERSSCCSVVRPWVTMIADVTSAAWVGWRIGRTPTATGVAHALRTAIRRFGVPQSFYRDNGKEFVAARLGGRAERLRGPRRADLADAARWPAAMPPELEQASIWHLLGIRLVTALPYSSWSKPIESFFHAFSRMWENLVPGYTGRDAKDKPELLEQQIRNGLLLTWDEFARAFHDQVVAWNTQHTCGERTGPPASYYADHHARRPDDQTLAVLLQDQRTDVRVRQEGIVLRDGGDVHAFSCPALAPYVGMRLPEVRWDPAEPDVCYAYTGQPGEPVLAVPRATMADWDGWGEANAEARRSARAQREYLARTRDDIAGALEPDQADPTGTFRTVWARMAANRARQAAAPHELAAGQARALEDARDRDDEEDDGPDPGSWAAGLAALR